jgi:hypothetical protein
MSSQGSSGYPVTLDVEYPDRALDRVSTFFRIVAIIPILIVLALISGPVDGNQHAAHLMHTSGLVGGGVLFGGPLVMILFRQKYPRWWFDWNLEFTRFAWRIGVYAALMDDRYPSTDEQQSVRLDIGYPNAHADLNRWMPLVKWLAAIPHYVILVLLHLAALVCVVIAWFAILFTGRYPRGLFGFIVGVQRWTLRVLAYAFLLTTDRYPPLSLDA